MVVIPRQGFQTSKHSEQEWSLLTDSQLITRGDIKVFLPPIGGLTVYCFGDPAKMSDPSKRLALRIHDEVRYQSAQKRPAEETNQNEV